MQYTHMDIYEDLDTICLCTDVVCKTGRHEEWAHDFKTRDFFGPNISRTPTYVK